jgi:hypothetical protein
MTTAQVSVGAPSDESGHINACMHAPAGVPHRPLLVDCRWVFLRPFAWYAVQVHQTKYLIDIGFSSATAAWALGIVSLVDGRNRRFSASGAVVAE